MTQRCHNPKRECYPNYGGRGIIVCKKWRESFEEFIKDVGDRPTKYHTIDRVNNNGNYEPNNIKWSTRREQAINTRIRIDNASGVKGVHFDKLRKKWMAYITINKKRISLGRHDTREKAICARLTGETKYLS